MALLMKKISGEGDAAPAFGREVDDFWGSVVRIWNRRWLRAAILVLVVLIALATAWYQFLVVPTLTAMQVEVRVAGNERRLTVTVEEGRGVAFISGGQAELSTVVVVGGSLFVRSDEVGVAGEFLWVEIGLTELDPRYSALTPGRILAAFDPQIRTCDAPSEDAAVIVRLMLTGVDFGNERASVCYFSVNAAADEGEDVLVERTPARPTSVDEVLGGSVVSLAAVSNAATVLASLNRMLEG